MKRARISRSILALLMTLLVVFPTQFAHAENVFTVRGGSASASAGEQVTVDIDLENNPGIIAICVGYTYDAEYFALIGVENRVNEFSMTHGVSSVWDSSENYTEDGILATLTFEVLTDTPAGVYEIVLICTDACNEEFEEVAAETSPVVITVAGDDNNDGGGEVTTPPPSTEPSAPPVSSEQPVDPGVDDSRLPSESGGEDEPVSTGQEDPAASAPDEIPQETDTAGDSDPEETQKTDDEQAPSGPDVDESPALWTQTAIPAAALVVVILLVVLLTKKMKRK